MSRTAAGKKRTLGPVSDLERHLPSEWWRYLFNSVYLKTDGDVVENPDNTHPEVDLVIQSALLSANDRILDMCCGQGRHSLELSARGFRNVTGIDRSRYLIRLARKRAKAMGLAVNLHEGDARKFRGTREPFHCVMLLGNSFGYFDLEQDDDAVLQNVHQCLSGGGTLVLDITDGDWMRTHFQPRSWEWADGNHLVCRERELSTERDRLITREVVVHAEKGVIADQFYAERLYSLGRITRLLESHGFGNVTPHGQLEAVSDRGHDLGMMANRLFLTARAPRMETAQTQQAPMRNVTVLLGDPSLPDAVKRGGQFNTEDLDTVSRLKTALQELPGYRFEFEDDHSGFLGRFKNRPCEFVFNLCDEGFYNDPLKELHVTAMLELFGIPYTGAGTVSLGLCYNKALVRAVAQTLDIPVPLESFYGTDDMSATIPSVFPALVKPNQGDSSMGITKNAVVHNTEELMGYLEWLHTTYGRQEILIQEFLSGREFSVGVIGNPGSIYKVLPVLEVDYSRLPSELPHILSYESKWHPESPYWTDIRYRQADLSPDQERNLFDYSNRLFERLGCRDYARFDFRCDTEGTIKLMEVNPNPGWCWDGKLNLMAEFAGMRYAELLGTILDAAHERVASTTRADALPAAAGLAETA